MPKKDRKFELKIDLEHDAFGPDWGSGSLELARLLSAVAYKVEGGELEGICIDNNGNKCGRWTIKGV